MATWYSLLVAGSAEGEGPPRCRANGCMNAIGQRSSSLSLGPPLLVIVRREIFVHPEYLSVTDRTYWQIWCPTGSQACLATNPPLVHNQKRPHIKSVLSTEGLTPDLASVPSFLWWDERCCFFFAQPSLRHDFCNHAPLIYQDNISSNNSINRKD